MKTVGVSCSRPAWGAGPHKGSQVPCAGFFLWMFQKWGKAVHLQTQQLPHPGLPGALAASSHAFVTLALSILLLPANTPLSCLPESAASSRAAWHRARAVPLRSGSFLRRSTQAGSATFLHHRPGPFIVDVVTWPVGCSLCVSASVIHETSHITETLSSSF